VVEGVVADVAGGAQQIGALEAGLDDLVHLGPVGRKT